MHWFYIKKNIIHVGYNINVLVNISQIQMFRINTVNLYYFITNYIGPR